MEPLAVLHLDNRQCGCEVPSFKIRKHLKSGLFGGRISNSQALALGIAIDPTIQKLDHLKSRHSCPDFKWFLTKWPSLVWISNVWASRFQMAFKIQSICNSTSFWPFVIQTSPDFRSPLYIWKNLFLPQPPKRLLKTFCERVIAHDVIKVLVPRTLPPGRTKPQ